MMMKAFSKGITKAQMQAENKQHEKMDSFRQGSYFDRLNKGCAVGCSIKSICNIKNISLSYSDHLLFEEHLGLPYWIAKLADSIFEGLSIDNAKKWTGRFINAVVEGSDVSSIQNEFLARVIESTFNSYDNIRFKKLKNVQEMVIAGLREGDKNKIEKARKVVSVSASAAYRAAPTDYAATKDWAAYSALVRTSDSAVGSADAATTDNAVDSVAAAASAFASASANAASARAARENSYLSTSNILIELLESCEALK